MASVGSLVLEFSFFILLVGILLRSHSLVKSCLFNIEPDCSVVCYALHKCDSLILVPFCGEGGDFARILVIDIVFDQSSGC